MDIKEKQKLFLLFGIFGIAAVILYYNLLLKVQFSKFLAMNKEFQIVKARVKTAEELIVNQDRIKRQYESLVKGEELLKKRFPGQDEISSLLEDFSKVAGSSGVRILRIKPLELLGTASTQAKTLGFYSEFPILVEARAGYHECGNFINNLENMERFIRIEDIEIRGRAEDSRHHDIKIRVSTYITY
jgi:Tfp pilus assembly protein PilO